MPTAQQQRVAEAEQPPVSERHPCMRDVTPRRWRVTPRPAAPAIARNERPPQPRRHRPHRLRHLQRNTVGPEDHPRERAVGQQSTKRGHGYWLTRPELGHPRTARQGVGIDQHEHMRSHPMTRGAPCAERDPHQRVEPVRTPLRSTPLLLRAIRTRERLERRQRLLRHHPVQTARETKCPVLFPPVREPAPPVLDPLQTHDPVGVLPRHDPLRLPTEPTRRQAPHRQPQQLVLDHPHPLERNVRQRLRDHLCMARQELPSIERDPRRLRLVEPPARLSRTLRLPLADPQLLRDEGTRRERRSGHPIRPRPHDGPVLQRRDDPRHHRIQPGPRPPQPRHQASQPLLRQAVQIDRPQPPDRTLQRPQRHRHLVAVRPAVIAGQHERGRETLLTSEVDRPDRPHRAMQRTQTSEIRDVPARALRHPALPATTDAADPIGAPRSNTLDEHMFGCKGSVHSQHATMARRADEAPTRRQRPYVARRPTSSPRCDPSPGTSSSQWPSRPAAWTASR